MKDVTSTSFGLLIAYVLPGLAGLYGLSPWLKPVNEWFDKFKAADSDIGLFLLVLLASIIVGLQLQILRYLVFEKIFLRGKKFNDRDFRNLSDDKILSAYIAVADQHHRFHQFWGAFAFAIPILFCGWISTSWSTSSNFERGFAIGFFVVNEAIAYIGACVAWQFYINRGSSILKGT